MIDLSEPARRLLDAIVSAPLAWQTPDQLAARLGLDTDSTLDGLAELDVAGLIDPWDTGTALFVTLTPASASALGVRLVPIGKSDAMRWAHDDEPEPDPHSGGRAHEGMSALDYAEDPRPGPDLEAEASERAERMARANASSADPAWLDTLPRPTILLGSGLTPWPGPSRDLRSTCPACQSEVLAVAAYCLVCDRWGLDHVLGAFAGRTTSNRKPRRSQPNSPRPNPSDAALAKVRRKDRRRLRWAAQEQEERAKRSSRRKIGPSSV